MKNFAKQRPHFTPVYTWNSVMQDNNALQRKTKTHLRSSALGMGLVHRWLLYLATYSHCLKGAVLSSKTCLMQKAYPLSLRCLQSLGLYEHKGLLSTSEKCMCFPSYITWLCSLKTSADKNTIEKSTFTFINSSLNITVHNLYTSMFKTWLIECAHHNQS